MSEGTMQPQADQVSTCSFDVEQSMILNTGSFRYSVKFSDFNRISTLKTLFASVILTSVTAEIRQDTLLSTSPGYLNGGGHIFVAVIPTNKDTDSATGSSTAIVNNVPNKQTFGLHESMQNNVLFNFNLKGFEVDLAQDPRRGSGPVAWLGNSGVRKNGTNELPICTVTWRIKVTCSGPTPLWA